MGSLEGKVALITGATSGIGEATAMLMARRGACVVLAGRRVERGTAVERAIDAAGGDAVFIATDVTRRGDVEALVDRALTAYGRIDCAVNNAGIAGPVNVPVAEVEEDEWDEVIDVNLRAVWLCMKYEIPAMLERGGSIVNVSSIYGIKPSPVGHAPYAAAKHAVIGLTKSAAIDYAEQHIRCNVVAPGYTRTEMVDPDDEDLEEFHDVVISRHSAMRRLGTGLESAEAIAWLCSDAAGFVNGAVITIDGGDMARLY